MTPEMKNILKRSAIRAAWIVVLVFLVYLLQGCGEDRLAPVEERDATLKPAELHSFYPPSDVDNSAQYYHVQPGDTLYSIAFRYGLDYKVMAQANNLDALYTIQPNQRLDLQSARDLSAELAKQAQAESIAVRTPVTNSVRPRVPTDVPRTAVTPTRIPASKREVAQPKIAQTNIDKKPKQKVVKKTPTAKATTTRVAKTQNTTSSKKGSVAINQPVKFWMWPAMGAIIQKFSNASKSSKGLDIAGNIGDPVRAAAAGQVVYAGRGLRGYGNLVIVKHNNTFISAYAHNSEILVKENEIIKAGQIIAKIGNSDSDVPKLHFEIRLKGKPVDPMKYLAKR